MVLPHATMRNSYLLAGGNTVGSSVGGAGGAALHLKVIPNGGSLRVDGAIRMNGANGASGASLTAVTDVGGGA